jgi:hypothetical protein
LAVSRGLALGLTVALVTVTLSGACATKSSAVGPGGECFLATDCQPGLICIEQPNKTRVCSDDLSRVAGRPPPEGGADDDAGEGGVPEGSVPGPDANVPQPDTGLPDTGTPDTGSPVDSGVGD